MRIIHKMSKFAPNTADVLSDNERGIVNKCFDLKAKRLGIPLEDVLEASEEKILDDLGKIDFGLY